MHLAMGWLVTLSVPMLVLIQNWSLCAAQLTSKQMAKLEVWGGAGGVIRNTNSVTGGHGNRLVKRWASTAS